MLIRRAEDTPGKPVEMDGVKDVTMRLMVGRQDGAPTFSMRHFTVEPGGHTPHHSHNYEHEIFVVEGAGEVVYEGESHPIQAGDVLFVEPNKQHQFVNKTDQPMKFLCLVPVQFNCADGTCEPVPGS